MAKILIEKGADINFPDAQLKAPTHYAAINNNVEVMALLIKKGADFDTPDNEQMTPVHYAAQCNSNAKYYFGLRA